MTRHRHDADIERFLSPTGRELHASAIQKMGAVAERRDDLISFAAGYPAADAFPLEELRAIAQDLLSGEGAAIQYGLTRGHAPLIEALAGEMARRWVQLGPEQLLVTTGSQQGLDLAARVLVGPGETVLVELPTFTGGMSAFQNVQANLIGVRQAADGIDLDDLERISEGLRRDGTRIKLLYVVPNFQNPTGRLLSAGHRRQLLDWAERYDTLIVEDDPYGSLYFEGEVDPVATRPLKADDAAGRVIYLSSFSKTLAPGFRVGWVAAAAPFIDRFVIAKQAADLATGTLDQRVAYEAMRRGVVDRLVPRLRSRYRAKRDRMIEALTAHLAGRLTWQVPCGGFFLWATLPAGEDDAALLARALDERVIFVTGSAFFVDGSGHDTIRLAFSSAPDGCIEEGVARLARALTRRPVPAR
jgi:2-aminoadipate transaminase